MGWCRRVHHFVSWHTSKALRHQDNKNISQEERIFNSTCYLTTTWDTVFSKNSMKMFHWHHSAKHVYYLVGHFSLQCEGYGDNKACRKQNTARKTEDSDSNPLQKIKKIKIMRQHCFSACLFLRSLHSLHLHPFLLCLDVAAYLKSLHTLYLCWNRSIVHQDFPELQQHKQHTDSRGDISCSDMQTVVRFLL